MVFRPHLDQPGREGRGGQGEEWEGEGEEETRAELQKSSRSKSSPAYLLHFVQRGENRTLQNHPMQLSTKFYRSKFFCFLQLWRQERCWGDILGYDSKLEWIRGGDALKSGSGGGALLGLQVFTVVK